jgi:hypothetical protein
MNRRTFVYHAGLGSAVACLAPVWLRAAQTVSTAQHLVAQVISAPEVPLPKGKRRPFGWQTVAVAAAGGAPLVLAWPDLPAELRPTHFRLAIGLDERDEKTWNFRCRGPGAYWGRWSCGL